MDESVNALKTAVPLGNFVALCKRKNKNLETTKLVGISVYSVIIDNIREVKESYLKTGWIAEKGDFVIDLVNIQNNVHLAVDINRFNELVAISHIYNVFLVTNSELMKEYLLIMFKNSKIEKWLKWVCHGSIRGTLSWDNFIKFPISLPPLEVQKRIVNNYETLGKIIQFKKKINELLEEWMQCLFHSMFDDLEEFTHETFGNLFQIIKGSRPPRSNYYWDKLYYCRAGGVPFLQVKDISKSKCKFLVSTLEQLTEERLKKCRGILLGGGTSFFVITELPKQLKI